MSEVFSGRKMANPADIRRALKEGGNGQYELRGGANAGQPTALLEKPGPQVPEAGSGSQVNLRDTDKLGFRLPHLQSHYRLPSLLPCHLFKVERDFSSAGATITAKRSHLKPARLEQLVMLGCASKAALIDLCAF